MTMFYQCRMRRDGTETVGWIEERGAKVGASVELISADGEFWTVVEVYKFGLDEAALRAKQARDRDCLPSLKGH